MIPIYECKLGDEMDETGVFAMSFVEYPANESEFVALKKQHAVKLSLDNAKQILTGVVLKPDQLIYREDEQGNPYYIKFTAQDIERVALKMMRTGIALNTTTHQHAQALQGNYLVESWIVVDSQHDKSTALGLGEQPVGTLMASYKIADPNYWQNEVMTNKVKGFSIEGFFNFNNVNMNKQVRKTAPKGRLAALFGALGVSPDGNSASEAKSLATIAQTDATDSGEPYLIFNLSDGTECWVDETGAATLGTDGTPMPSGEHALEDGNFITIDNNNMLTGTAATSSASGANTPTTGATGLSRTQARARAKQLLQHIDPKTVEINKLKARLSELERQPSAGMAKASISSPSSPSTHTEKMAAMIASRRARK